MQLRIENYDNSSIFVFYDQEPVKKGAALLSYVASLEQSEVGGVSPLFDFTDFHNTRDKTTLMSYSDKAHAYLKLMGLNVSQQNHDYFDAISEETVRLMRQEFEHPCFQLSSTVRDNKFVLNRFNVLVTLRGDFNRMLIFSLSESMADVILKKLVEDPILPKERKELLKATVSELANIIVGLSLKHYTTSSNINMSIPMFFESYTPVEITANRLINQTVCTTCSEALRVIGINF